VKSININIKIVKPLLFLSKLFNDNYFIIVCKGYNEDYENYTGLYWSEDKDLDISDEQYSNFKIWYKLF
jgi:hypothetical protein